MNNGEKFSGNFWDDVAEGPGIYYTSDNKEISGVWKKNMLV